MLEWEWASLLLSSVVSTLRKPRTFQLAHTLAEQQVQIGGIRLHPKFQEGFSSNGSESANVENVAN